MLSKDKIKRINELAKISKERELTQGEKKEQKELREQYLQAFRKSFKEQLDCIEVVDK